MPVRTDLRLLRDPRVLGARRSAIFVAILFAVTACGGGDTTDAADETPTTSSTDTGAGDAGTTTSAGDIGSVESVNACGLITPADIQAALQLSVEAGELFDNGSVTTCAFKTSDHYASVDVSRFEPVGDLIENTLAADPKANDLPGVGDAAIEQIYIGQVTMRVGDVGVVISSIPPPALEGLVQLARTAAGSASVRASSRTR